MPQYVDIDTGTLYDVNQEDNPPHGTVAVVEADAEANNAPARPALRRQLGGFFVGEASSYFSTRDNTLWSGRFDLNHSSNQDLILISNRVDWRPEPDLPHFAR